MGRSLLVPRSWRGQAYQPLGVYTKVSETDMYCILTVLDPDTSPNSPQHSDLPCRL